MKESFEKFIHCLDYKSLVFLYQACADLRNFDNIDLSPIEELIIHFMEDEELEQDVKYNNILKRISATGEEFAYSVRDFKTEYLWDLCEFFEYAYSVSKNDDYHRTYECIILILRYRKEMLDLVFSKCKTMSTDDIRFYIELIPRDVLDKMGDYMLVPTRNITLDYLKDEFSKVKKVGSV